MKEDESTPFKTPNNSPVYVTKPHISPTPSRGKYNAPGSETAHTSNNKGRRRSSLTTYSSPNPSPTPSSSLTSTLNFEQCEPNNNNEEEFYTPLGGQTPNHKHLQEYKLHPNDTFARLEGKQPKPNTKMQSKVDAVGHITGHWGKWQLRTVLLIFLCKIPSSWFMACIIFTAPAPRHGEFFCKPPSEIGVHNQTAWIKVSHPQKEEKEDQEFTIDFCNVYEDAQQHAHHYYKYADSAQEPRIWEKPQHRNSNVIPCTEFQHESTYQSVVTQYDLVCSRDILVSVTQFFHLFGVLTGGILANHLLKQYV